MGKLVKKKKKKEIAIYTYILTKSSTISNTMNGTCIFFPPRVTYVVLVSLAYICRVLCLYLCFGGGQTGEREGGEGEEGWGGLGGGGGFWKIFFFFFFSTRF